MKENVGLYHHCPGKAIDACGGVASCYPVGADAQRWHVQANLKPRHSVGAFFGPKHRATMYSSLIASNRIRTARRVTHKMPSWRIHQMRTQVRLSSSGRNF